MSCIPENSSTLVVRSERRNEKRNKTSLRCVSIAMQESPRVPFPLFKLVLFMILLSNCYVSEYLTVSIFGHANVLSTWVTSVSVEIYIFFPLFHSWKLWSLIGHSSEQSQLFEVLKKKIQSDNTFIGRLIKNLFFYKESILEIESLLNLFSWSARTQTNKQFSIGLSEQWTCDEKFM